MMSELAQSVEENIRERIRSPLLGAYTIGAVLCNWQVLVVLVTAEASGKALVKEIASVFPGYTLSLIQRQ